MVKSTEVFSFPLQIDNSVTIGSNFLLQAYLQSYHQIQLLLHFLIRVLINQYLLISTQYFGSKESFAYQHQADSLLY